MALDLCQDTIALCCYTSLRFAYLSHHSPFIVPVRGIPGAHLVLAHDFPHCANCSSAPTASASRSIDAPAPTIPRFQVSIMSFEHIINFDEHWLLAFFLCETTIFPATIVSLLEPVHTIPWVTTLLCLHEITIWSAYWAQHCGFLCWHTILSVSAHGISAVVCL